MNVVTRSLVFTIALAVLAAMDGARADDAAATPAEKQLTGPNALPFTVRMQGPYDADVVLQVVCYFKRTDTSDQRMTGAPVELDKRLSGVIGSLRTRGEFAGEALETLLIKSPPGTIKPKYVLLVGLGDEPTLSRDLMERIGRVSVREAARIGAETVAFAPLIKDQGNDVIPAGQVATSVARGAFLAYDTERRLQTQGLANPYQLKQWVQEAGPKFYDETIQGVEQAINDANQTITSRDTKPYATTSK